MNGRYSVRQLPALPLAPVDKLRILRRDRWQCRMPECLCPDGRAIDPALLHTNGTWAPTVDHIRQRADGGDNRDGNLRAAHRMCNKSPADDELNPADPRWPVRKRPPAGGHAVSSLIDADLAARLLAAVDTTGQWRTIKDGLAGREYPENGPYRYLLGRSWAEGPVMCLVMLNPSTATWQVTDPTVTRCRGFAEAAGCGSLVIVNLFGLRSRDPRHLLAHREPVGPGNDEIIVREAAAADLVVCAWGANAAHRKLAGRRDQVTGMLAGMPLHCLGTTRDGDPRHPLMLPGTTPLARWDPAVLTTRRSTCA